MNVQWMRYMGYNHGDSPQRGIGNCMFIYFLTDLKLTTIEPKAKIMYYLVFDIYEYKVHSDSKDQISRMYTKLW